MRQNKCTKKRKTETAEVIDLSDDDDDESDKVAEMKVTQNVKEEKAKPLIPHI